MVDNEAMLKALNDKDTKAVMKAFCQRLERRMGYDDAWSCALTGLWRCLKKHEPGKQKFTTNLCRYMRWDVLKELSRRRRTESRHENIPVDSLPDTSRSWDGGRLDEVKEKMDRYLSADQRKIVTDYFLQNKTFDEISRDMNVSDDTTRKRFNFTISRLRELCKEPDAGVLSCE